MIEWNDITPLRPSNSDQYTSRSNSRSAEVYRTWKIMLRLGYSITSYAAFWDYINALG